MSIEILLFSGGIFATSFTAVHGSSASKPEAARLIVGSYLDGESDITASKKLQTSWLVLVEKKTGQYSLIPTDLRLVLERDDKEFGKLYEVKPKNQDVGPSPIAYLRHKKISPRKLITLEKFERLDDPMARLNRKIPSAVPNYFWELKTSGPLIEKDGQPMREYALYLSHDKLGDNVVTKIEMRVEGDLPEFILSGDMNGDGIPDLLWNESDKYSIQAYRLYISKKKKAKIYFEAVDAEGNGPSW